MNESSTWLLLPTDDFDLYKEANRLNPDGTVDFGD